MPRNPYTHIPIYPETQMPRYPYTHIPIYPETQIPRYPYTHIPIYPETQMPRNPDTQIIKYPDAQKLSSILRFQISRCPETHTVRFLVTDQLFWKSSVGRIYPNWLKLSGFVLLCWTIIFTKFQLDWTNRGHAKNNFIFSRKFDTSNFTKYFTFFIYLK